MLSAPPPPPTAARTSANALSPTNGACTLPRRIVSASHLNGRIFEARSQSRVLRSGGTQAVALVRRQGRVLVLVLVCCVMVLLYEPNRTHTAFPRPLQVPWQNAVRV